MYLTFKMDRSGKLRPFWYGVFRRGKKTKVVQCGRIAGTLPASRKASDTGDAAFEQSRQRALTNLGEHADQRQSAADQENLVQKIHELRYGAKIEAVPLADMDARWGRLPRKRKFGVKHAKKCRRVFSRFVQYMADHAPSIQEMGAVTGDHMRAFMDAEAARDVTNGTWNETLALLKGIFRRLEPYSDAWHNYLSKQPAKDRNVMHREPFTAEEITAIVDAADAEPEIKPLIITALCTAMRRGDVCRLRWKDVDLKQGFITVKTSKTGATVEIPVFPILRAELEKARGGQAMQPDDFVFPEAAALYAANPHGLNWRLKSVLERAGFLDPDKIERMKTQQAERAKLDTLPPDELLRRGLSTIAAGEMSAGRRTRMREIFTRYLRGDSVKKIAAELPAGVGTVSGHLAEVERMTGAAVVRRPELPAVIRGATLAITPEGMTRKNRAVLKGWHSFRTTWITLALSAGVPEMIVRRVTGHATADVVLKHYFRPGREQFRAALAGALPKALTAGTTPDKDAKALRIVRRMTPQTCVRDKARLLELLAPKKTGR